MMSLLDRLERHLDEMKDDADEQQKEEIEIIETKVAALRQARNEIHDENVSFALGF